MTLKLPNSIPKDPYTKQLCVLRVGLYKFCKTCRALHVLHFVHHYSQYIPPFGNGQIQDFYCKAPFTRLIVQIQGDSGGPLTTTDQSGAHTLIGILSQQLGSSCSQQVVC